MITSEIIINKLSVDTNNKLEFNEKELHDTIDNIFNNIGDDNQSNKKTLLYYIRRILCC